MTSHGTIKSQQRSMDWKLPLISENATFLVHYLKVNASLSRVGTGIKSLCRLFCTSVNYSGILPSNTGKDDYCSVFDFSVFTSLLFPLSLSQEKNIDLCYIRDVWLNVFLALTQNTS